MSNAFEDIDDLILRMRDSAQRANARATESNGGVDVGWAVASEHWAAELERVVPRAKETVDREKVRAVTDALCEPLNSGDRV